MAHRLDDIVEVIEVGSAANANKLLTRGYKLLVVEQVASGMTREKTAPGPQAEFWVAKHLSYCFGRTKDQEPFSSYLEERRKAREAKP